MIASAEPPSHSGLSVQAALEIMALSATCAPDQSRLRPRLKRSSAPKDVYYVRLLEVSVCTDHWPTSDQRAWNDWTATHGRIKSWRQSQSGAKEKERTLELSVGCDEGPATCCVVELYGRRQWA